MSEFSECAGWQCSICHQIEPARTPVSLHGRDACPACVMEHDASCCPRCAQVDQCPVHGFISNPACNYAAAGSQS